MQTEIGGPKFKHRVTISLLFRCTQSVSRRCEIQVLCLVTVRVTKSPVLRIPAPGYPENYTNIFLAPRGPFVTRLLREINELGIASPIPDWEAPLDKREPVPEERIGKANALIQTWSSGATPAARRSQVVGLCFVNMLIPSTPVLRRRFITVYFREWVRGLPAVWGSIAVSINDTIAVVSNV